MLGEMILWAVLVGNKGWPAMEATSCPTMRMDELLGEKESFGPVSQEEMSRLRMNDPPCHMAPDHVDGGTR